MLPYDEQSPPSVTKAFESILIARNIGEKLFTPPARVGLGLGCVIGASVPETTANVHSNSRCMEYDIDASPRTGNYLSVESISKP